MICTDTDYCVKKCMVLMNIFSHNKDRCSILAGSDDNVAVSIMI